MTRVTLSPAIVAACALAACLALLGFARGVEAQAATGTIRGAITSGTQGVTIPDSIAVRMIVLDDSRVSGAIPATVSGGRYSASLPMPPSRVYIPHVTYEGVDYFGELVTLTESAREVTRDFRVYGTTRTAPDLAIVSSTVTVVAIDRTQGKLGLLREDMIANPSDRVFIGDESGITLRIPAPTGTTEATGDESDGEFKLERGVLTATTPIRPGRLTPVLTRYVVAFDREVDQYALRVTASLPAERLTVRVPVGAVASLTPETGAHRVEDERTTPEPGQPGEGQVLQIVQSNGSVQPGGGIVVHLVGLSQDVVQTNPLTEPRGAAIAGVLALLIVGGGTFAVWRWRGRVGSTA